MTGPSGGHVGRFQPGPGIHVGGIPQGGMRGVGQPHFAGFPQQQRQLQAMQQQQQQVKIIINMTCEMRENLWFLKNACG